MEVKMDADAKAQRSWHPQDKRPNLFQWLLIISLGVFIGNIATLGVERAVTYWEIYQVAKAVEAETEQMKLRMDAQQLINRERSKLREIEIQNKQAAIRQANETCNFWRDQFAKKQTSENRMHRDDACALYQSLR